MSHLIKMVLKERKEWSFQYQCELKVQVLEDFGPELLATQAFELNHHSGCLSLIQCGPYGYETFVLGEKLKTAQDVYKCICCFEADGRGHLLQYNSDGQVTEPGSGDDCCLCLEPMYARYEIKKNLPCRHSVCLACLSSLEQCKSCPLCREPLGQP